MIRDDVDWEFELHAYVDGDLDEESMSRVEQRLEHDSIAAARVSDYLQQKNTLRALAVRGDDFGRCAEIDELTRRLARQLAPARRWGRKWHKSLVLAAMIATGWVGHMILQPIMDGPSFAQEAVQAHLLMTMEPGEVMPISQERLTRLFSRVGIDERLPDLARFGYEAVGAELVPSDGGILLHVPYRDANGTTVSYFLIHDANVAEVPRHILHRDGITLAYWQHQNERYAVAAPLSDDEITRIAAYVDAFELKE